MGAGASKDPPTGAADADYGDDVYQRIRHTFRAVTPRRLFAARVALNLAVHGAPGWKPGSGDLLLSFMSIFGENFEADKSVKANILVPLDDIIISEEGLAWIDYFGNDIRPVAAIAAVAAMPFVVESDGPVLELVARHLNFKDSLFPEAKTLFAAALAAYFDRNPRVEKERCTRRLAEHFSASARDDLRGGAGPSIEELLASWGVDLGARQAELDAESARAAIGMWSDA